MNIVELRKEVITAQSADIYHRNLEVLLTNLDYALSLKEAEQILSYLHVAQKYNLVGVWGKVNQAITDKALWNCFPDISSMNTYDTGSDKHYTSESIKPRIYSIIQNFLGRHEFTSSRLIKTENMR